MPEYPGGGICKISIFVSLGSTSYEIKNIPLRIALWRDPIHRNRECRPSGLLTKEGLYQIIWD